MKKSIIITIVAAILFFIAGFIVSSILPEKTDPNIKTYEDGWADAVKRLSETRPELAVDINNEKKNITGTIVTAQNNSVSVDIIPLEPLADPELDKRIVKITDKTKIYKYIISVNKSENILPSGLHDPDQVAGAQTIKKTEVKQTELRPGQRITVFSDIDIKNKKQFNASEIIIEL